MGQFKYTLIGRDDRIRNFKDPHSGTRFGKWMGRAPRKLVKEGHEWVRMRGGSYLNEGKLYPYEYRLIRSFGLFKYWGMNRIWREGNPHALDLNNEFWRSGLDDAAFIVENTITNDPEVKLMRPRKYDMVLMIVIGIMAAFIGFGVGRTIK